MATERPWQPHERNYSGNRVGIQHGDDGWTILTVLSGDVETTTSIRDHDAWDFALRLSPKLKERLGEVQEEVRTLRQTVFNFTYPVDPAILRSAADAIDCGEDCEHGHTEHDTNAFVCSRDTCPFADACELREFATALEAQAARPSEIEDEESLIDLIESAIDDSMDMDWRYRDGAKAVAKALMEAGAVRLAPPAPSVKGEA